ncbi:hypothetical protein BB560_005406 [Smittium megazygosporum]|uniref:Uncharacterized protein n=1 Tax=Smittium megazygosporum TaxID=133381 RepID=A0A2T9Z6C7_9FUNG|nr:hypothetical protein BB560_005406 [Smittium megazygosporum]
MHNTPSLDLSHRSSLDSAFSVDSVSTGNTQSVFYEKEMLETGLEKVTPAKDSSTGFWGTIKSLAKGSSSKTTKFEKYKNATNKRRVPGFILSDPTLYGSFVISMESAEEQIIKK